MKVGLRAAVREAIVAHARAEAPLECCGLLLGTRGLVEDAHRAANVRQSPTTYRVDPADHFAAIRRARATRREVVGAYHSHPRSPAVPSATDLREAHDRDFVYLIVSLADPRTPELRGYRLLAEDLVEVTLVVVS